MPRILPKKRWKLDEVVVAITAFATDEHTIRRGTRLRGDHPAVKRWPHRFMPDGAPAHEWPPELADVEVPQHAPEFHRVAAPIADEDAAVATVTFEVGRRRVYQGQRLRRDDPVVKANPDLFRTPMMRLC